MTYEKIIFFDGNRRRSIFLRIEQDKNLFIRGIEVNREGDEKSGPEFDQRRHIIDKTVIFSRHRYVMDNHYGILVPANRSRTSR